MKEPSVICEVSAGIATLTLNEADNKNALSNSLVVGLANAIETANSDDSVRVMVLTNNGNTFCAGADLKSIRKSKPQVSLAELFASMQDSPKPIIGRIAGHCMGGGVGLAVACDLSIAADDILLGFTEVRLGVAPAIISVVCLPKMRHADAMDLFLTGERISAKQAVDVGLINNCTSRDSLDSRIATLVSKVVRGGPAALAACKRLVFNVPSLSRDDAFTMTSTLSAELFGSEEAKEGISAFREKHDPRWVPKSG